MQIDEIPGIKIFKCKSPIYFANIDYFKEKLRDEVSLFFAQILNSEILKGTNVVYDNLQFEKKFWCALMLSKVFWGQILTGGVWCSAGVQEKKQSFEKDSQAH